MRKILTGLTAATLAAAIAVPAYAATPKWKLVQVNHFPDTDYVQTIASSPGGSTWAGGFRTTKGATLPLVQHWTGKTWATVTAPDKSLGVVSAMTVLSAKNVWAFGYYGSDSHAGHWDGKRWSVTKLPTAFRPSGADAADSKNVWAVGEEWQTGTRIAMHWNGKTWQKMTLPVQAEGIDALSAKNVWASGKDAVMHWNGKAWAKVKLPAIKKPKGSYVYLHNVVAMSTKNVWAVGGTVQSCGPGGEQSCYHPLTLHWNGKKWTVALAAKSGSADYTRATSDGSGGLWMTRGTNLVHLAKGKTTTVKAPIPASGYSLLETVANHGKTIWAGGVVAAKDGTMDGFYLRLN